jgi:hypothetical protein
MASVDPGFVVTTVQHPDAPHGTVVFTSTFEKGQGWVLPANGTSAAEVIGGTQYADSIIITGSMVPEGPGKIKVTLTHGPIPAPQNVVIVDYDEYTGDPLFTSETIYHRSHVVIPASGGDPAVTAGELFADQTNARGFFGLQSNGKSYTGQQLSYYFFKVIVTDVVSHRLITGITYTTNDTFTWPPVLSSLGMKRWTRHDGGVDIYPDPTYSKEHYNGSCKMEVSRAWSRSAFTIAENTGFRPSRITYSCPFFMYHTRIPVLHGDEYLECDIGSSDPVYAENSGSRKDFAATNYTDWPDKMVVDDKQEAYKGGYLRTTNTAYKPST